ncbi:MAG: hypothetical protein WCE63_03420 [Acidobacteriaceae bacterium]
MFERPQYSQKRCTIIGIIGTVARKMDIDAPAAKLRAQIAKRQKFVSAEKHMDRTGTIGNGFNDVQLV